MSLSPLSPRHPSAPVSSWPWLTHFPEPLTQHSLFPDNPNVSSRRVFCEKLTPRGQRLTQGTKQDWWVNTFGKSCL